MICPYGCSACHEFECRDDEGGRMTGQSGKAPMIMAGEMGMMPCEGCGTLIILHVKRVRCVSCLVVTVTARDEQARRT